MTGNGLKYTRKYVFPKVQQNSWAFRIIRSSFFFEHGELSDFALNSNFKKEFLHAQLAVAVQGCS